MKEQLILIYSYLHGIWRYRWSALAIAWVVALPGWVAVYALPDQYTSQAIMHIDTKSVMQPLLKGLAVESEVESGLAIMRSLLLSRNNLEEVIRETGMDLKTDDPNDMDRMVAALTKSITFREGSRKKRRKDYTIFELSYQGSSADQVYQVVSKLLNILIETTLSSARTDTEGAQLFLDQQIAEYEKRLTTAEQKLADFKRANLGFMPDEKGGYYKKLQGEQNELENIRSELRLAERRLLEMRTQLEGETPLLGNNDYSAPHIMKLRRYREQLEILLTQYTEQHPDVQALRSTIADSLANKGVGEDEFIGIGEGDSVEFSPVYQELRADINRTSVEVETMKIRLVEKANRVEKLKQSVDIIPEVEAKLAKLNRDYEITRERHLSLIGRRESARMAQAVGKSGSNIDFRIIDMPRAATKPSGPQRLFFLSAVFFAAIGAGLGWGILRYLIHPTFIDTSQLRDKIGLPVLGSIGLHVTAQHKKRRKIQLTSFLLTFSLLVVTYGVVVLFKGPGSEFVGVLISSRGFTI